MLHQSHRLDTAPISRLRFFGYESLSYKSGTYTSRAVMPKLQSSPPSKETSGSEKLYRQGNRRHAGYAHINRRRSFHENELKLELQKSQNR